MEKYQKKIISWCLYVEDRSRRPEYLLGLRINQRAARKWFPGWSLRLYIDKSIKDDKDVYEYVLDLAKYGDPIIEIIEVDGTTNRTFDRYKPFFEKDVDVALARDIDSILSKKDAELVEKWLNDDNSYVLRYREYQMGEDMPMGGGIGMKRYFSDANIPFPQVQGECRGLDERNLRRLFLEHLDKGKITEHKTRMLESGVYCMYKEKNGNNLEDIEVLWPVPFYYKLKAVCDQYIYDNSKELVDICKLLPIRPQHIYSHYTHHNKDYTDGYGWVR